MLNEKKKYVVYTHKGKDKLRDVVNGKRGVALIIQLRESQGYQFDCVKRLVR